MNTKILVILLLIIYISIYLLSNRYQYKYYKTINHEDKEIVFGQTTDLTNNNISYELALGYQLAFQLINRTGGINGYKLKIILYDDKYDEKKIEENSKLLIDYYNVLSIIGAYGVKSYKIINNIINKRDIAIYSPLESSILYGKNFIRNTIFLNGIILYEFELILDNILKNNLKNICIIYQNDEYGLDSYNNFIKYIIDNNININIISSANYERGTLKFDNCFNELFNITNPFDYTQYKNNKILKQIDAVILFTTEMQINFLLSFFKKIKPSLFIYLNSFIEENKLNFISLKNYNKENIYKTDLYYNIKTNFPILYNKLLEEIDYYKKTNKLYLDKMSPVLHMGFYSGLLIGQVIKNFKDMKNINRSSFIDMFYKIKNFDIYGLKIGPFIDVTNNDYIKQSNSGIRYCSLIKLNPITLDFDKINEKMFNL